MRLSLLVLSLVFATSMLVAQTTRQDRLEDISIEQAARTLQDTVRSAVLQAGGDLERQHVHLVLAFSTGHFNRDPLGAQAARQIAWLLVKDLLVAGDKVSCFAWEMALWDHLQGGENTRVLGDSSEGTKRLIQDLFPNTVQDGSQGGHDTERAIVEITYRLGSARDAVIVLLTNDAQSVAPKGQRTIGSDNAEYRSTLQRWMRLPQVSKSGASLVLPYKVIKVDGSVMDRKLDTVVVVRRGFSAQPLLRSPRIEQLQGYITALPATPLPQPRQNLFMKALRRALPWSVLFTLLVIVVYFVYKAFGMDTSKLPAVTALKVGEEQIDITKVPEGQSICILAGENYKPASGQEYAPVVKVLRDSNIVLARLFRRENAVELQVQEEADLQQINGDWVEQGRTVHLLRIGEPYHLIFVAEPPKSTGPVRKQRAEVRIDWVFADSSKLQIHNTGG